MTTATTAPRGSAGAMTARGSRRATAPAVRVFSAPYWTSIGLTIVAATAAAFTLFAPGLLHGTPVMNGSARGTALVTLFVAMPVLVASMVAVAYGSARAAIAWLGATAFTTYNAVLFLFATPFNSLFLLYTAMFTLSFWSIVLLVRAIDVPAFAGRFSAGLPARALGGYLGAIAILNVAAWLNGVIPGLSHSEAPEFLKGTGLTTNPIYAQDLAFWLPLSAVLAVLLWRRHAWGIVGAGGLLVYFVIEGVSVAVDQWMGSAADPASTVASAAFTPVFAVIAAIGLIPLFLYMRSLPRA